MWLRPGVTLSTWFRPAFLIIQAHQSLGPGLMRALSNSVVISLTTSNRARLQSQTRCNSVQRFSYLTQICGFQRWAPYRMRSPLAWPHVAVEMRHNQWVFAVTRKLWFKDWWDPMMQTSRAMYCILPKFCPYFHGDGVGGYSVTRFTLVDTNS